MKKPRRHVVKPALLKAPQTYVLADGVLHCEDASGRVLGRIALAAVQSAHWSASRAGQSLTRVLRLEDDAGQRLVIRQHLYRRALVGGAEDMAFRACVADVLRALMAARPGLDVHSGPSAGMAALLRLLGAALLAGAVAAPVLALIGGQDLMGWINGAIPVALLGLLGLALLRSYAPGRGVRARTPAEVVAEIEGM